MACSPAALAAAFRRQSKYCAELGSPLWAEAMERVAADIDAAGPFLAFLADWNGDLERGILPLRLFGGFHYLALAGRAPTLAAQLPSTGGKPDGGMWPALLATLAAKPEKLRLFLDRPPQTNEVARSAIFLGGFLEVAARSRLPLTLCEVGASAGLNLCWDRFAYRLGSHRWGRRDAALTLTAEWRGSAPRLDAEVKVAGRQACDQRPVDLTNSEARLRLQGYVWPDHLDRFALLQAAMALAVAMEIRVERAAGLDWTRRRLAARLRGEVMVIYHSVVLQYFDAADRKRFREMIEAAGRETTSERPLAWLAYEQPAPDREFELTLAYWPGGERRRLAVAQAHGRWVEWQG